jgi:hypothetical protein
MEIGDQGISSSLEGFGLHLSNRLVRHWGKKRKFEEGEDGSA